MGNIGDSRAILGSKDSNDSMVATQLTVDLKPDLPSMLNTFSKSFFLACMHLSNRMLLFCWSDRGS